jgi:hypothetical protein
MSEELESRLRALLRPVPPGEDFSKKLIARATAGGLPVRAMPGRRSYAPAGWLSVGMAASLLLAVGIQHHWQERRERERGMEARREVIEALRVTSQKLHLAYETVEDQS